MMMLCCQWVDISKSPGPKLHFCTYIFWMKITSLFTFHVVLKDIIKFQIDLFRYKHRTTTHPYKHIYKTNAHLTFCSLPLSLIPCISTQSHTWIYIIPCIDAVKLGLDSIELNSLPEHAKRQILPGSKTHHQSQDNELGGAASQRNSQWSNPNASLSRNVTPYLMEVHYQWLRYAPPLSISYNLMCCDGLTWFTANATHKWNSTLSAATRGRSVILPKTR